MDVGVYPYSHGDSLLIDKIVNEFLSQGKFDKLRKECMSDADTKPAYQNLQQRVESTVTQFLKKQVWRPDLNKNQLRDTLRKHILDSNFFDAGINRIVDQVVNPNVLATVFLPEVEEVVYNYLSIPRPTDKAQRKAPSGNEQEKLKPPGSENDNKCEDFKKTLSAKISDGHERENRKVRDSPEENNSKESVTDSIKVEPLDNDDDKTNSVQVIKTESNVKEEDFGSTIDAPKNEAKIETLSDETSQDTLFRVGVEKLKISDVDAPRSVDSDDSMPLEINENSMNESRGSEDSIMNQMSPISQGRLTPDLLEESMDLGKSEKEDKAEEEKKPLTFIGRIPKIKREDSESSKSSRKDEGKGEKAEGKNVYSSDESDSSKSNGKSDSDEKKSKYQKKREESRTHHREDKNRKGDLEKKKKDEDRRKSSKDKDKKAQSDKCREFNSKTRKRDKSRGRSRDRNRDSKKNTSSSREKCASYKHSRENSRHRESKSKDRLRESKRKDEEKKKSKNADDHAKERQNKKDGRRSTDRDSNERDRAGGSRSQGEDKGREKEERTEESRREKSQKGEAEVDEEAELTQGTDEVVIQMAGDWVSEGEEIVLVNEEGWICTGALLQTAEKKDVIEDLRLQVHRKDSTVDLKELIHTGALTKITFPKIADDFYVKFNSTGFKYFEDWERCKLDCEEEFKDFVDDAEKDLGLLSDDGSESESSFLEENRKTMNNLRRGLGNFKRGLTFDPNTYEFYKWTNNKFYQTYRKKNERNRWKKIEKNESDESIKENIDRVAVRKKPENLAWDKKAMHLKLLNRLKRRAIRQGGKPRRRYRRKPSLEGIKEKNENLTAGTGSRVENDRIFESKAEPEAKSVESSTGNGSLAHSNMLTFEFQNKEVGKSPDVFGDKFTEKRKKPNGLSLTRGRSGDPQTVIPTEKENSFQSHQIQRESHLPLSPESDDYNGNNTITATIGNEESPKLKRTLKADFNEEGAREKKQQRRNYSQKYDSQDLYKPRPVLNSSRVRARGRGDPGRESETQM